MEDLDYDVSICIANYNMSDTIEESLNSVLEGIPSDYELVIVDESDDGSKKIIDNINTNNPIKKIYVEGIGLSRSRNLAVKEATGDIVITHVDMDDWYDSAFFEPFVDLYLEIKKSRGDDLLLSCPNFNITGKEAYIEKYQLRDLPIGVGERDYRWRSIMAGGFVEVKIDKEISGRIKKSDRKGLRSRAERTLRMLTGLFQIGYTTRRIIDEEVNSDSRPFYSQIFILMIIPISYVLSRFKHPVDSDVPTQGDSLGTKIQQNTYTLSEIQEKYNISRDLQINSLAGAEY